MTLTIENLAVPLAHFDLLQGELLGLLDGSGHRYSQTRNSETNCCASIGLVM